MSCLTSLLLDTHAAMSIFIFPKSRTSHLSSFLGTHSVRTRWPFKKPRKNETTAKDKAFSWQRDLAIWYLYIPSFFAAELFFLSFALNSCHIIMRLYGQPKRQLIPALFLWCLDVYNHIGLHMRICQLNIPKHSANAFLKPLKFSFPRKRFEYCLEK